MKIKKNRQFPLKNEGKNLHNKNENKTQKHVVKSKSVST